MLPAILSFIALFLLIDASPIYDATTVKIRGNPRTSLFRRADGTFNYDVLNAEILKTKSKYSMHTHNNTTKRAVAKEQLKNWYTGGLDVEYYGPISIGDPAQTLGASPIRPVDTYETNLKCILDVDFDTGSAGNVFDDVFAYHYFDIFYSS